MLKDSDVVAAKKCVAVLIDSYKKVNRYLHLLYFLLHINTREQGIWNDARTVNVIAQATHAKDTGLRISTINFFLGNDEEDEAEGEGIACVSHALRLCNNLQGPADDGDDNDAVHTQLHIPRGAATKSKQQRKRLQKAVQNILHS
jgi:hypothetical protein